MDFHEEAARLVAKELGKSSADVLGMLETPPDGMGNIAFPCFTLAKELKKNPNEIAKELAGKIHADFIISCSPAGPYVNITIKGELLAKEVLSRKKKGLNPSGPRKQTVMIEFSQPNTHKQFHIGHLRNACLGDSIVRLRRAIGDKVIPVNYIGDIGAHVAKCLWNLKKFHADEQPAENKGAWLGSVYIEASERVEKDETLKDEIQEVQRLLETGDKEWNALWKETRQWSLDEFKAIYETIGVSFDKVYYESQVEHEGKKMVDTFLENGMAQKSEGAVIIDLKQYGLDIFLLLKRDGTSLYSTKDLALAKQKFKDFTIDESIILTDSRQAFYFKQLFKTLDLMGFTKKLVHVPYEFVSTPQGVIASRAGNVILFEDYYSNAKDKLRKETKERHADWPSRQIEENAGVLSLAALKFWMLKHDTGTGIMFTMEEALSLEGETGPYLLYVIARINSITRQAKPGKPDYTLLTTAEEEKLITLLWQYPSAIGNAARQLRPHLVCRHLLDLAQAFNTFYHEHPVLKAEPDVRNARLTLINAVRETLAHGLNLLGIQALEEM